MTRVKPALLISGLALAAAPAPAFAQSAPVPAPMAVPMPSPEPVAAPAPAEQVSQPERTFPVYAYKVVGNTVLDPVDVEQAVMPFLGPDRKEADVEGARAALEKLYNDKGFATVGVTIPDQSLATTIIRLDVIEQRVGAVRVAGTGTSSAARIERLAPSVKPGVVPNLKDFQRDIVALNQVPDRTVTPDLKAGSTPNTVDVELAVEEQSPLHASVELNNRASIGTRPLRVLGTLEYDDLWQRGHQLQLGAQYAPERPADTLVLSGSYLARFVGSRATLRVAGTYSDSNVGTIGGVTVLGRGYTAGFRLALPIGSGGDVSQTFSLGFDYKRFRDKTQLLLSPNDPEYIRLRCDLNPGIAACQTSFTTPIRYFPATLDYQATWFGDKSRTSAGASLVLGFRGLGSTIEDFANKRYLARPNFFYVRASASNLSTFKDDFQFSGRVQAQYTPDPLITNEQFVVGGLDSVRGYFESESLGDVGVSTQVEWIFPSFDRIFNGLPDAKAIKPAKANDFGLDEWRFHLFGDSGVSYLYDAVPGQRASYWLASVGAGVRVRLFGKFTGSLDVAFPLRDGPSTRADGAPVFKFRIGGEM